MAEGSKIMPKMTNTLAKTLGHRNFEPAKFAKSISAQSDGDKDLQENRQRIQTLGDDTAQILKKQVYLNYQQFIDTAKEISYLEGEMFQLNHILTEQKNLMESMVNSYASKTREEKPSEEAEHKEKLIDIEHEQKKAMSALLGKVEGCSNIIETKGRYLIHDGDVIELDTDKFSHISKIHLFLFNDSLLVTTWVATRRGNAIAGKYKFQVLWEIDTLAVVNARSVGPGKNAFKVMIFPDARMFQCETSKEKREWLDNMDKVKRKYLSDKEKKQDLVSPTSPTSPTKGFNPFMDFEKIETSPSKKASEKLQQDEFDDHLNVDWLQQMPEDLDVYIAQRNFEQAVDSIAKTNAYLEDIPKSPLKQEFETKLFSRTNQLVDVLARELRSSPDRSLRGGPRVVRRPVVLLIRLNEISKACNLFLANRSSAVAFAIRQLRTEGSLSLYIGKLCKVFFSNMNETAGEFNQAFQSTSGCYSEFVVWAQNELTLFVSIFAGQVFGSSEITEVAECVATAQNLCHRLKSLKLDLDFFLNSLLSEHIERFLKDHKQKLIDATKLRNSEELWKPTNLGTPQNMESLIEEMMGLGIKNFMNYCYDECFVRLTGSTIAFTRSILIHVESAIKMMLPDLQNAILSNIITIVTSYTDFTSGCLKCETERPAKAKLIKENAMFVAECLIPILEGKIQRAIHHSSKQLVQLRISFTKEIS